MILGPGWPLDWAMASMTATVSRAASSCRHKMTTSTPAIRARLALASLRSSGAMLTNSMPAMFCSRSRICKPVVPASPSIKTLAMVFVPVFAGLSGLGIGTGGHLLTRCKLRAIMVHRSMLQLSAVKSGTR